MKRVIDKKVIKWANDRGLLKPENAIRQTLKTLSEAGELADAINEDDEPKIKDAIGDIQVCLNILCEQKGYDMEECLMGAFNEIENRTGKTVDGVFIKDK